MTLGPAGHKSSPWYPVLPGIPASEGAHRGRNAVDLSEVPGAVYAPLHLVDQGMPGAGPNPTQPDFLCKMQQDAVVANEVYLKQFRNSLVGKGF